MRLTHDQDTGSTASVAAEVLSTNGEESWVHRSLKEEDGDQNTNSGVALSCADDSVESNGNCGIDLMFGLA